MSNVFKLCVPPEHLWNFLKQAAVEQETKETDTKKVKYHFTKVLYKQAEFRREIVPFLHFLLPFYYDSKRFYAEKKGYKAFLTVLRQLCHAQGATYDVRLVYEQSSYEIEYFITGKNESLSGGEK